MSINNSRIDVYGIGQCALDYIGKINTYPEADTKCEFVDLQVQGGGPIATALVALSRWGYSTVFSGVVGDDDFGGQILSELKMEGVDIVDVVIRKAEYSQFAFIVAEPADGRRTIFWRRPTGSSLDEDEVNLKHVLRSRLLHTDGIFARASIHACRSAFASGIPVCVDAGSMREGMLEIASCSTFFLASKTFATAFLGHDDPGIACERLKNLGPEVVCVTRGADGYTAIFGNKMIEKSAYPAIAIDTTGCGDLFHAGFIYGILQNWHIEKCFDYAAWAAAMVSQGLGGRNSIPHPSEWISKNDQIK
jgi:sulfofructose kinase